jgi:hypothetical protein
VEQYFEDHSEVEFSHGICPDCYEKVMAQEFKKAEERNLGRSDKVACLLPGSCVQAGGSE